MLEGVDALVLDDRLHLVEDAVRSSQVIAMWKE